MRHVIVEVHDDQGDSDNSQSQFAVLCLNDTFVKFIEQRSAVLKGMHDQIEAPSSEEGFNLLVQHFNCQSGFVRWGNYLNPSETHPTTEERESPGLSGHWEIVINSAKQAVLLVHHDNDGCRSTGLLVDRLSGLGHIPETSYVVRDDKHESLADHIRDYFYIEASLRSVVDLEPLIRQVHAAIAATETLYDIEPLDDLDQEDTQENADEAVEP